MHHHLLRLLALTFILVAPAARATGLIIPIYGNSTGQFNAAIEAAKILPVIAIINPDNGAGSRKDNFIAGKVAALKAAGAKVGGYIATGYASVPLGDIKVHADNYTKWYGVAGYFLDEMSDSTSKLNYYKTIRNYAVSKGQAIVGNPGTAAPAGYAGVTDVIITYEDPYSRGFANYRQPSWTASLPVTRMGAIVYSAGGNLLTSIIDRAISQRYGWIYVTDKNEPDPFGSLPSYFANEAYYLRDKNSGK
jgi:hypothetical protein